MEAINEFIDEIDEIYENVTTHLLPPPIPIPPSHNTSFTISSPADRKAGCGPRSRQRSDPHPRSLQDPGELSLVRLQRATDRGDRVRGGS